MLEAVKVCGRWICERLLQRVSRWAKQHPPPTRTEVVRRFCLASGWLDAKGRPCVGTASVALDRLEEQGQVCLPPRPPRAASQGPRALHDDGQGLPPLPRLPARAEAIAGLRLHLIQDPTDPKHPLWNRLITREHPLGQRPLVGAQLRYLVECDQGVLGALGFGPPAFHLACRDQWIGWSPEAQARHRPWVIGLSRFVLRRGLHCPNLASGVYGRILPRVASDWEGRYGVRPVLVETYVDRQDQEGRSLAASNWRRLGQSSGRGRDDPKRQRRASIKDLWVYELEPGARGRLQSQPVRPVVPRSVFALDGTAWWVEAELDELDLGHRVLERRTQQMLAQRWARPGASFYTSFGSRAAGQAAYRWVENPRAQLNFESVLRPHQEQTARRMAAEKVVLLAQDTTTLSYNGLEQTQGLGPTGEDSSRGMFLHTLLAFRLDGIVLGTAWAECWARPPESDTARRNQQSVDEKESGRWVRALQAAIQCARRMPQTQLVVCGDRESDIYELYDQLAAAPTNVHVLVRAQHDRTLGEGPKLWAHLEGLAPGGTMPITVPRRKNQPSREAVLELRWAEIEIPPPAVTHKKGWPSLKLSAVMAREVGAPPNVEPIEWVLWSNWPVQSFKTARRLVCWYALRWGIECWHRVLKLGCGVEKRQFKNALGLQRALGLDMIVATRVLLMVRLGKEHPDLPASVLYTPDEVRMLETIRKKAPETCPTERAPSPRPSSLVASKTQRQSAPASVPMKCEPSGPPVGSTSEQLLAAHARRAPSLTVLQANLILASLAGSWSRRRDQHPGAQTLVEGLRALHLLMWYEGRNSAGPAAGRQARRSPT